MINNTMNGKQKDLMFEDYEDYGVVCKYNELHYSSNSSHHCEVTDTNDGEICNLSCVYDDCPFCNEDSLTEVKSRMALEISEIKSKEDELTGLLEADGPDRAQEVLVAYIKHDLRKVFEKYGISLRVPTIQGFYDGDSKNVEIYKGSEEIFCKRDVGSIYKECFNLTDREKELLGID